MHKRLYFNTHKYTDGGHIYQDLHPDSAFYRPGHACTQWKHPVINYKEKTSICATGSKISSIKRQNRLNNNQMLNSKYFHLCCLECRWSYQSVKLCAQIEKPPWPVSPEPSVETELAGSHIAGSPSQRNTHYRVPAGTRYTENWERTRWKTEFTHSPTEQTTIHSLSPLWYA